ncbi:MAG: hypothetical protein AB2L24_14335 [Mangrovibacterium sp.]
MRTIYYLLGITFCCLFICSCSKNDPDNTPPATGSSNSIIDYIWYRNASPTSHEVVRDSYAGVRYISDHYPVTATFDLN